MGASSTRRFFIGDVVTFLSSATERYGNYVKHMTGVVCKHNGEDSYKIKIIDCEKKVFEGLKLNFSSTYMYRRRSHGREKDYLSSLLLDSPKE